MNAMESSMGRDRDLVLAPGEFAYVLDTTKGLVNVIVGPNKTSMSNTDQPVVWNTVQRRFTRCEPTDAVQAYPSAPEGYYLVLTNPAENEKDAHPREGTSAISPVLKDGRRVNIPGPTTFPLWPRQSAQVIQGHHLRSNQYLLVRIYNDEEARANWTNAVVKPATTGAVTDTPPPTDFTLGKLMAIRGTNVAFFIPPTGVEVVPEVGTTFVREAVTLERLEYCILLDEDGNKRFVKGPDVVFPEPTEQFVLKDNQRKFRAIELNETTGIYVKVIADYTEKIPVADGVFTEHAYKAGDELFITGKEQAIYFQREEHSVIRYGEQTKHYAVAIPAGEGRYVLNRVTGVIQLVKGPRMLLCDPRYEIIVRRVLSEKAVKLWYPGNDHVLEINRQLAAETATPDATQYEAGRAASLGALNAYSGTSLAALNFSDEMAVKSSRQIAGDVFSRGTKFTPPRTITLDTKYDGAVSINVWTGYAVLVVNKTGQRHVVVGPQSLLLEYDETLAPLELSTGKPKSDAKLYNTAYLRVSNNRVTDQIRVETQDLVPLNLTISYRVNFEGDDHEKWFAVENYIQLLCDHMRSMIRNVAKRTGIEAFYTNAVTIIRDTILGASTVPGTPRPGRTFDENGMRVYDVEILDVVIDNPGVASLLGTAQINALKSAIQISEEERELAVTIRSEDIKRAKADTKTATQVKIVEYSMRETQANMELAVSHVLAEATIVTKKLEEDIKVQASRNLLTESQIAIKQAVDAQVLETKKQEIVLELQRITGETEEIVKRAGAVSAELAVALTTFSDQALIEKISTTLAPMALMSGVSVADVLSQLFSGTPFEGVMKTLGSRSRMALSAGEKN